MVRTYTKKRDKPSVSSNVIKEAISDVNNKGFSLRSAALKYGMSHTSLYFHLQKYKKGVQPDEQHGSRFATRQVFTTENEALLENYIIQCSKLQYGLRYKQIRALAYEFARKLDCSYPESWNVNKCAGPDWMDCFMKRHPNLALREPENTSQARCSAFNKTNLMEFFDNYQQVLKSGHFTLPIEFITLIRQECQLSTVVQAPKVIVQRGIRQVGQDVSAERGTMIKVCMIVNAIGNSIPPVFIFLRARMHATLMFGAPIGSLGLANSPNSSWMTSQLFIKVPEHIQRHSQCSKDNKIIVLMDNHESHCNIEAINFALENGIVLLTFPSHCTHRMQPPDTGSFQGKSEHRRKRLDGHESWETFVNSSSSSPNTAYLSPFTKKNILSAFDKTGIWPFSRLVFSDSDFEPSTVTGPMDGENISTDENVSASVLEQENADDLETAVTPETLRSYPKRVPISSGRNSRKKAESRILTSSPVRTQSEADTLARKSRKSGHQNKATKRRKISTNKTVTVVSYDAEDYGNDVLNPPDDRNPDSEVEELDKSVAVGSYVICNVPSKIRHFYCVGCVEEQNLDSYHIKYLEKLKESYKFTFPKKEIYKEVEKNKVIVKLPPPQKYGGIVRTQAIKTFDFDFTGFKDILL